MKFLLAALLSVAALAVRWTKRPDPADALNAATGSNP